MNPFARLFDSFLAYMDSLAEFFFVPDEGLMLPWPYANFGVPGWMELNHQSEDQFKECIGKTVKFHHVNDFDSECEHSNLEPFVAVVLEVENGWMRMAIQGVGTKVRVRCSDYLIIG